VGFAGTTLTEKQWAALIVEEAHKLGFRMTPRQVAEGLGVREAEGFTASGAHIGPWEESSAFGTTAERLNYRASTRAALKSWKSSGESWWPAWGKWETAETEGAGPTRYKKFMGIATRAVRAGPGSAPAAAHPGLAASTEPAPAATSSSGSSSFGADLMHFGLIAVLVVGGVGMIGLGTTRVMGTAKGAPA
jgi:hypothetical protein